jgi:hypothetical protein
MRMRPRRLVVAGVGVPAFFVLAVAGSAHAKIAPSEITIEGKALATPIHLDIDDTTSPSDPFYRIVEGSGFFAATYEQVPDPMVDTAPTDALGEAVTLTYAVDQHGQGSGTLHQTVYPHAEGGPLVYTEPGQRFFESMVTAGGWYRASRVSFVTALEEVGVPVTDMRPPASATPSPGPVPVPDAGDAAPWLNGAVVAAMLLGVVGTILAVRRIRLAPG